MINGRQLSPADMGCRSILTWGFSKSPQGMIWWGTVEVSGIGEMKTLIT